MAAKPTMLLPPVRRQMLLLNAARNSSARVEIGTTSRDRRSRVLLTRARDLVRRQDVREAVEPRGGRGGEVDEPLQALDNAARPQRLVQPAREQRRLGQQARNRQPLPR